MRRAFFNFILVVWCLSGAGCARAQLGLPRTPVSVASPDGTMTAYVRNHPNIDPPSQSLWLRRADGGDVKLVALSGDHDWCNLIVWSADSSRVGFLVQDAKLAIVDAATARVEGWTWLVNDHFDYPPAERVTDLAMSSDGREATYRICPRWPSSAGPPSDDACLAPVTRALLTDSPAAGGAR
jgi:hypothetical protein